VDCVPFGTWAWAETGVGSAIANSGRSQRDGAWWPEGIDGRPRGAQGPANGIGTWAALGASPGAFAWFPGFPVFNCGGTHACLGLIYVGHIFAFRICMVQWIAHLSFVADVLVLFPVFFFFDKR
jgi:hypothetical protein